MIKINYLFEKNAIHNKIESVVSLIQITGEKELINQEKRKLNISISIDISSSMGSALKTERILKTRKVLKQNNIFNPQLLLNQNQKQDYIQFNNIDRSTPLGKMEENAEYIEEQYYQNVASISKIEQAKNAAIKAIEKLNVGDFISIVCFDDKVNVLVEATKINAKNKKDIIEKIKTISVRGSTNLHDGWLTSATEVAKNISEKYINRVIILTDGQANAGIVDPKEIENNVFKLYKKSISTTCIGLGEGFNENLLEAMSNSGGGNFYFIEKDAEIESMFNDEFSGLSNVVATDVKIKFIPNESSIKTQLNSFIEKDGEFLLSNILNAKNLDILFDFNIKCKKHQKHIDIGKLLLTYKDEQGILTEKEIELILPIVKKATWENMEYNEEVKVQETLMTVANNKFQMASAIERGDVEFAKGLMASSASLIGNSGYSDHRLFKESTSLNETIFNSDNMSSENLKKTVLYQSYQTRNSK